MLLFRIGGFTRYRDLIKFFIFFSRIWIVRRIKQRIAENRNMIIATMNNVINRLISLEIKIKNIGDLSPQIRSLLDFQRSLLDMNHRTPGRHLHSICYQWGGVLDAKICLSQPTWRKREWPNSISKIGSYFFSEESFFSNSLPVDVSWFGENQLDFSKNRLQPTVQSQWGFGDGEGRNFEFWLISLDRMHWQH